MKNNFKITYENQLDVEVGELSTEKQVLSAAKQAREAIISGLANTFIVEDIETGIKFSVDLSEDDNDAVLVIEE